MANTFNLEIVAIDKKFYSGPCEMIIFPAMDGQYGVLPNHETAATALVAGELKYKVDEEWIYAAVGTGFVEITPKSVIVLVDTAETPEEIDIRRANLAKERAEEKLIHKRSQQEYLIAQAALARAMARLKVSKRSRK